MDLDWIKNNLVFLVGISALLTWIYKSLLKPLYRVCEQIIVAFRADGAVQALKKQLDSISEIARINEIDAVKHRTSIQEKLTTIVDKVQQAEKELRTNGGSSLKDAIHRVELEMDRQGKILDEVQTKVAKIRPTRRSPDA